MKNLCVLHNTTLIVVDARPFLMLAIAGSLDALLLPGTKIIIPDMVRHVASDKPGYSELMDWLSTHQGCVCIAKTETFHSFKIIRGVKPDAKIGFREERSAGEVMYEELESGADEIIMLYDESDIIKPPRYLRPFSKNVSCMSASMLIDAKRTEVLLEFSRGLITKEQVINAVGGCDYAELLLMLGNKNIPLPSLSQDKFDRQVNEFVDIWRNLKCCAVIIPDAGPLISLWVADQLPLLLVLDMKIIVLDVVYDNLTSDNANYQSATGKNIKEFIDVNQPTFIIEETSVGQNEQEKVSHGEKRSKNAGELAITDFMTSECGLVKYLTTKEPVFVLFEDSDIQIMQFRRKPPNLHLVSTVAMLRGLEILGVIKSADLIIDKMLHGRG